MHPFVNTAVRAARKAGDVITRSMHMTDRLTITNKDKNDFVSEVDRRAEEEIIAIIRKAYPDHAILAEESGKHDGSSEYQWIIDPLDGTTNFLHGFPQFSVSIAVKCNNRIEHGVIYDPIAQELFTASVGDGAILNDHRIRVTNQKGLHESLLGTGFPYKDMQHLEVYLESLKAFIPHTAGIRRAGSAALDLAYVAAGRLDGFWEIGLNQWDIAAGVLMVEEAGGMVGDFTGGENYLTSGNIVCGSPKVYKAMLKTMQPLLPKHLQC